MVTKQSVSELMDGELARGAAAGALDSLPRGSESAEAWRVYHLIGDSMRGAPSLSDGFGARLRARLDAEPVPRAPDARTGLAHWLSGRLAWPAFSAAAAGLAAIALVGWMAFAPQPELSPLAEGPQAPAPATDVARVPPPETARDYLLAHQGYSPRNSLQGVAPYVRTVSGEAAPGRR